MNFDKKIFDLIANEKLGEMQTIYISELLSISSLAFIVIFVHLILKGTLLKGIEKLVESSKTDWDNKLFEKGIFNKVTLLMPWVLGQVCLPYFLGEDSKSFSFCLMIFQLGLLIQVCWIINSALSVILDIYQSSKTPHKIPINGFIQVIRIVVFFFTVILFIAILLNKPPFMLLSGLGALTAVIMLVFKDTILGFVAGIQLIGNKMIAPGDRIEMPNYGADGTVKEVALTTVKVSNWDKTITTIPTTALVTDSFRNWEGMKSSGRRMISRTILINLRTVKFCDLEMLESLSDLKLIHNYVEKLILDLKSDNGKKFRPANKRTVTNLGIFRHYIINYLRHHENITNDHKNFSSIVGETEPNEKGVGLSILAYYEGTDTHGYHNTIGDVFDHLFAVIHEFELDFYQLPSDSANYGKNINVGYVSQD